LPDVDGRVRAAIVSEWLATDGHYLPDQDVAVVGFGDVGNFGTVPSGTPREQRRDWRYRRLEVDPLSLNLPEELEAVEDEEPITYRAFVDLCRSILAAADPADANARWSDRGHVIYPLVRSSGRAKHVEAALALVGGYFDHLVGTLRRWGPRATAAHMREIVHINGFTIGADSVWGGATLTPVGASAAAPEFPAWLVREEMQKVRAWYEHTLGRKLTDREAETIALEAAQERLRFKQNALLAEHGIDLSRLESLRRSDRRRRQKQRFRRTHIRVKLTLRDRILVTLQEGPVAGKKALARRINAKPAAVIAELAAMQTDGLVTVERARGKDHIRPVPNLVPPTEGRRRRRLHRGAPREASGSQSCPPNTR
jgi:hypothetical protein